MSNRHETEWRAYRATIAQTRARAAVILAPRTVPTMSKRAQRALKRAQRRTRRRA